MSPATPGDRAPLTPREAEELLPFYVNGTLDAARRQALDDYLQAHPAAQGELRWHQALQVQLREDVPAVSSEIGLDRAMARIHGEAAHAAPARRRAAPDWRAQLGDWLSRLLPQPVLRPALVAAGVVVAVQAVVIGGLMSGSGAPDEATELRSMPGQAAVAQGPFLKVNFKPDATEADIRLLLVQVHGSLAAGPGQLGDYYVQVPATGLAAARQVMQASAVVDSVALVDGLPPRP